MHGVKSVIAIGGGKLKASVPLAPLAQVGRVGQVGQGFSRAGVGGGYLMSGEMRQVGQVKQVGQSGSSGAGGSSAGLFGACAL